MSSSAGTRGQFHRYLQSVAAFAVFLVLAGCSGASSGTPVPGATCQMNSECAQGLTCSFGHCQSVCKEARDCPTGGQCVKDASGINSCLLPVVETCNYSSQCPLPLTCANDMKCRNQCLGDRDCATSTAKCVLPDGVCAEPTAINTSGTLKDAVADAGAPSAGPDAATTPLDVSAADLSPDVAAVDVALDVVVAPVDATGADLLVGTQDAPADVPTLPVDATGAVLVCANGCDDGLFCTTDTCAGGVCQSTLKSGYCVIDNTCYRDADTKPGDTCQACTVAGSTSLWTPEPEGTLCGTEMSCQSHVCTACGGMGQACCGTATPGTCVVGAACNASTNQCQADKAIDISGTYDTVCALFQSGHVRCWGTNGTMLGATTGSNVATPPTAGLEDAVNISVGYGVVCAVRATGGVVCWGDALPGGGTSALSLPIPGITNAKQISAGPHTCVRTAESKVLCWGSNDYGELGLGTTSTTATTTPQEMLGVTDARSVAACQSATCVLRNGGQVSCTGAYNQNGFTSATSTIADIPGLATVDSLSCSSYPGFFCAVTQTGTLICWSAMTNQPAAVLGAGQVLTAAAVGSNASYYAIQQDRTLWGLGFNGWGELGDGTFTNATVHTIPRLIHSTSPASNVAAIALVGNGRLAACLLRTDGSVSCAGQDVGIPGTALGDGQQNPQAPRAYFVPVVGILPAASEDGQCYDGVDNDGDGKTDLDDSDCAQDLGSATGSAVATVSITGVFGNYLKESCNGAAGDFGGPEAVLTWTAPSGGTYQFDTSGSTFDTVLAAYKGNPLTSPELACNDDGTGLTGGASAIKVQVITGDKLTIVVDSKAAQSSSTSPASFTLNITKQ